MGGLLLLVFFGLAGIFWTLLAAAVWVRRRSLPLLPGGLAATCTVFIAILLIAGEPGYSGETGTSEYSAETPASGTGTGTPAYSLEIQSQGERDDARAWAHTAQERARVDRLHQQWYASSLERYRQANGRYPSTLEEVGFKTPRTPYGPLHYYGGADWYLISFGDPSRDGFSADWDSRTQTWIVTAYAF